MNRTGRGALFLAFLTLALLSPGLFPGALAVPAADRIYDYGPLLDDAEADVPRETIHDVSMRA